MPRGSGYFTCKQNIKLVTTKFKSGGLHEKHVVATWNLGNHLSICFWAQGNQEKPVSRWPVAGPSEYWLLASSPASKVKKKAMPTQYNNAHKIARTRQLQQYTRSTNNNYTEDKWVIQCGTELISQRPSNVSYFVFSRYISVCIACRASHSPAVLLEIKKHVGQLRFTQSLPRH